MVGLEQHQPFDISVDIPLMFDLKKKRTYCKTIKQDGGELVGSKMNHELQTYHLDSATTSTNMNYYEFLYSFLEHRTHKSSTSTWILLQR
jgi:hypothetical protein